MKTLKIFFAMLAIAFFAISCQPDNLTEDVLPSESYEMPDFDLSSLCEKPPVFNLDLRIRFRVEEVKGETDNFPLPGAIWIRGGANSKHDYLGEIRTALNITYDFNTELAIGKVVVREYGQKDRLVFQVAGRPAMTNKSEFLLHITSVRGYGKYKALNEAVGTIIVQHSEPFGTVLGRVPGDLIIDAEVYCAKEDGF
jgi:hypothetical protein